jgi:hypothetical protein
MKIIKSLLVFIFVFALSSTIQASQMDSPAPRGRPITQGEAVQLVKETLTTIKQAKKDLEIGAETHDKKGVQEYVEFPRLKLVKLWSQYDLQYNDESRQLVYCLGLVSSLAGMEYALMRPDGIEARKYLPVAKADYERSLNECEDVALKIGAK